MLELHDGLEFDMLKPSTMQWTSDVEGVLERHHHALHSGGPYALERVASELCGEWYLTAPWDWPRFHPLGDCPNTAPLRALLASSGDLVDVDGALALGRALAAMYPTEPEPREVALELDAALVARGGSAPAWAGDSMSWRPIHATAQFLTEECTSAPNEQLACVVTFEHESGDRHCLAVSTSPLDRGAACRIEAFPDQETAIAALNVRQSFPFITWPRVTREPTLEDAGDQLAGAIRYAYKYEFRGLQDDPWSCALMALLHTRVQALVCGGA